MIEWAAGDLFSLFALQDQQLEMASAAAIAKASKDSENNLDSARAAQVDTFKIASNIGHFIGPRGSRIRSLQKATNTLIYGKGARGQRLFMVFYHEAKDRARVLRRAGID